MKILKEHDEMLLLEETQAQKLFDEICKADIWMRCYTRELKSIPVDNAPILMEEIRQKFAISSTVSDESMAECMEEIMLGMSIPMENGYVGYPIGETALNGMVMRAGYANSPILLQIQSKESRNCMAPVDKATVLNTGYECHKNMSLILIRDEKVRAVLSGDQGDYVVLPMNELTAILKKQLENQFDKVEFLSGFASQEYTGISYKITGKKIDEMIRIYGGILMRCNIDPTQVKAAVKLVTSDVGLSGANLYPYLECPGGRSIMLGTPLSLTHKGTHTIADFEANTLLLLSLFKNAEERIGLMDATPVKNIGGMIRRLAKNAGLPKKQSCEWAELVENSRGGNCFQSDVFFSLYDILESYDADMGGLPSARRLSLEEGISRVAFGDIGSADIPYQWE